jgi:hypothetical protein
VGDEYLRPDGALVRLVCEEDEDHRKVEHYRVVDTLGLMLKNGTITAAMHDAGQQFAEDFVRAFGSDYTSPRFDRIPGGAAKRDTWIERHVGAAHAVRAALDAVGGIGSPAGSALWFVVGLQMSIRDWAQREGWNHRRLDRDEAKGYLVAALGVLARHYGYER